MIVNELIIYCGALVLGGLGALLVVICGERWSLLDRPNDRSSHKRVTPKGGGIGILVAFISCSIFYDVPLYFWLPAFMVSLLSFWGDRFELEVSLRLLAQIFLAVFFLVFVVLNKFPDINFWGEIGIVVFCALFIVGTANYYNFMDGINGIAAISGMVAFGLLGVYGVFVEESPSLVNISFSITAACAGFLPFNVPRARVFMGDVGSVLLGFVFAALVVLMAASVAEFVLLAGFLFPFYADELVTMIERIRDGDNLTQAHRRHLYQVLANEAEISHWLVTVGYGLMQLLVGLTIWRAGGFGLPILLGVLAVFFGAFVFVNKLVKRRYQSSVG